MSAVESEVHNSAALAAIRAVHDMPFPAYAARFLKIRTKTRGIQPFVLNRGQLYVHDIAERQLSTRGFVRIALLKARQWGGSTVVQARYYRQVTQGPRGQRAFILTQDLKATRNIFNMTKRFHDNMDPRFRPYAPKPASTHLLFPKRDSSYGVSTAGSKATGRSDTIQFFHGSEVAFWPNAEDHLAGVMQAIPASGVGTESILESTAKGMGNVWHTTCINARKRLGEYEFVFVPWFWFDEYRAPIPPDMILTLEDEEYMTLHGLDLEQMAFRHMKIIGFGGGEKGRIKFMQEYPAIPEEAFSADVDGSYLEANLILRARRARVNPYGVKVMGVDPAWQGKDRFSVICRQGRKAWKAGQWSGLRHTQSLGKLVAIIRRERPAVVFVDSNGVGTGIVDPLIDLQQELGIRVVIVMGAESADDDTVYANKRQECAGRMKSWFEQDQPVQIEDRTGKTDAEREANLDSWQGDLTAPLLEYDANNRPRLESKQKMKARGVPSPDDFDALSVTFAFEVRASDHQPKPEDIDLPGYKRDEDGYRRRPPNWRAV